MRTTVRCLTPIKAGVASGVNLLAKPVQFVMQTVEALHVTIVGEPGHRTSLLANRGNSTAFRPTSSSSSRSAVGLTQPCGGHFSAVSPCHDDDPARLSGHSRPTRGYNFRRRIPRPLYRRGSPVPYGRNLRFHIVDIGCQPLREAHPTSTIESTRLSPLDFKCNP